MDQWNPPQRPAVYAEQALITAILDGIYPPGSFLPSERELSARLGVTRPTLREALRRLESDGWLVVQQGKSTRINDFWVEGGLNVLSSLVRYSEELPPNFVTNLLEVRLALAPVYTRAAVERDPAGVVRCLQEVDQLTDTPEAFAAFDWTLHRTLTILSGNPIYTLILNGFSGFYQEMACLYFDQPEARLASRAFYRNILANASRARGPQVEEITQNVMKASIALWQQVNGRAARSDREVS
jgi:GntR family transcriptional regulator, negative regulator for fad regulon and positive regulator of fabA